jgi:predicted DNA-binding helix-hairpin-helix protein
MIAEKTITEPININEAIYEELIKIPGIGPVTAQNIMQMRSEKKIDTKNLQQCGVIMKRAAPFIKVSGEMQKKLLAFA